jgi:hypothetical protein
MKNRPPMREHPLAMPSAAPSGLKTKVYPVSYASMVLRHPIDGPLKEEGSEWTVDGFTARMLCDRAVTSNPEEAWKVPAVKAEPKPEASSPPIEPTK